MRVIIRDSQNGVPFCIVRNKKAKANDRGVCGLAAMELIECSDSVISVYRFEAADALF